ncbi:MAG: nucleoside triphosphate pyrophosphohydrolase [Candidatus Acidiferrales bacterium]
MPTKSKAALRRAHAKKPRKPVRKSKSRAEVRVTKRDKAAGEWFARLVALQARLRSPTGCPWDREQTHASLRKYLVEEAYEVLDAMDSSDPRKFASELGDLLLQVVFHANIADADGRFNISDVIESVYAKMVRRHPHVFGNVIAETPGAVLKNWEQIKAAERAAEKAEQTTVKGKSYDNAAQQSPPKADEPESILAGVPRSLPGVLEAYQLTRRASRIGFDWDNLEGVLDKMDEERHELLSALPSAHATSEHTDARSHAERLTPEVEEEVGDLLFAGVNVARFIGVDPESALKKANRKFKRRFEWMESAAAREGSRLGDLPRRRMEELWDESKSSI